MPPGNEVAESNDPWIFCERAERADSQYIRTGKLLGNAAVASFWLFTADHVALTELVVEKMEGCPRMTSLPPQELPLNHWSVLAFIDLQMIGNQIRIGLLAIL